jgi:hypothetical protein
MVRTDFYFLKYSPLHNSVNTHFFHAHFHATMWYLSCFWWSCHLFLNMSAEMLVDLKQHMVLIDWYHQPIHLSPDCWTRWLLYWACLKCHEECLRISLSALVSVLSISDQRRGHSVSTSFQSSSLPQSFDCHHLWTVYYWGSDMHQKFHVLKVETHVWNFLPELFVYIILMIIVHSSQKSWKWAHEESWVRPPWRKTCCNSHWTKKAGDCCFLISLEPIC